MRSVGAPAMRSGLGATNFRPTNFRTTNFRTTNFRTTNFRTTNFTRSAFFPHRFHRFHHRNAFFFGVGFAGPWYGDSCWRLVPTYWGGWRRVWVCGYDYDYPYWGYPY